MDLYTERNKIRKEAARTYSITIPVYSLILNCCSRYYDNLIWKYNKHCHHDFTNSDYIVFDNDIFKAAISVKIPDLYRDDLNQLSVPSEEDVYDKYALLDYIEFIAQNIKDIEKRWNSSYHDFQHISIKNTCDIFYDFQSDINEIFTDAKLLYKLNENKQIERIVENGVLGNKIEELVDLIPEEGIKDLLKLAIEKHRSPKSQDNKDAVEKIWDAFERLRTYYDKDKLKSMKILISNIADGQEDFASLLNEEFLLLGKIGNTYRIRHHETDKVDITDIKHYDYFFNRCLSLISLAIQYLK